MMHNVLAGVTATFHQLNCTTNTHHLAAANKVLEDGSRVTGLAAFRIKVLW
jgi:hypothetical protein